MSNTLELTKFEVGGKCPLNCDMGINIMWDVGGFLLVIKESFLSPSEIRAFRKQDLRIDATYIDDVIVFVFTIQNFLDASDIAFTVRLSSLGIDDIPELQEGKGLAMNMVLVEGSTNEIKGMRVVGLTTEMSKFIIECMLDQYKKDFNKYEHTFKCMKIQSMYSPRQLVQMSKATSRYYK